jgi:hypothetical protein
MKVIPGRIFDLENILHASRNFMDNPRLSASAAVVRD